MTSVTLDDLLTKVGEMIDLKLSILSNNHLQPSSGYISRLEVCKLLKITLPTLHDWRKQGVLRAYKIGSRVLYKEPEIIAVLEANGLHKHKRVTSYT